ncbi:MAG: hypothetical protein HYZ65_11940 [Burkholderiales bacterium]|nr:hypothetical protein [Burkholderiales bacterium]
MGKIWQSNKEAKKHALLTPKEKRAAKHAKKAVHEVAQWTNREQLAPKAH